MSVLILDRPWEANRNVLAAEQWLEDLERYRQQHKNDPEALAEIEREAVSARGVLNALRQRDAAGITAPDDDEIEL